MQTFEDLLREKGFHLSERQIEQFEHYFQILIEWNEKMNLTAITGRHDVYLKHFYDSLTPCFLFDFSSNLSICDIGAGAGFPSLPMKILFPQLNITIVDSLKKRISFLEHLTQSLELENVFLHHERAEVFGQNASFRESYDIVTARAVAKLNVLSEFCLPLVKVNGLFIALKGAFGSEEVNDSKKAISLLGGEIKEVHELTLPEEESKRQLIGIKKIRTTPKKFPRKPGLPLKQPL